MDTNETDIDDILEEVPNKVGGTDLGEGSDGEGNNGKILGQGKARARRVLDKPYKWPLFYSKEWMGLCNDIYCRPSEEVYEMFYPLYKKRSRLPPDFQKWVAQSDTDWR